MHDALKEEAIVNKVGGRFKLSTLIQKRMVALNTGARPLVDLKTADKMAIVIQEILQDKIYLDASAEERARRRAIERGIPIDSPAAADILAQLRRRDELDSTRATAPLRIASDAVVIRTDGNAFAETVAAVVAAIRAAATSRESIPS